MNKMNTIKTAARVSKRTEQRRKIADLLKQGWVDTKGMDPAMQQAVVGAVIKRHYSKGMKHFMKVFDLLPLDEDQIYDCLMAWVDVAMTCLVNPCEEGEGDDEVQELLKEMF